MEKGNVGEKENKKNKKKRENSQEIKLEYRYKKPVPHNYIIGHISFDFCPHSPSLDNRMHSHTIEATVAWRTMQ